MRGGIQVISMKPGNIDRDSLQAELNRLKDVADENDIVFLFVTGHSGYLRKILLWEEFFPRNGLKSGVNAGFFSLICALERCSLKG